MTYRSDSLKEKLFNHILPFVSKPGRYTGNEVNIVRKNPDEMDVRFALVFPDVYDVGMSYMGFQILYNILNNQKNIYAERAFAVWPDMEELMREKNLPLFSLETFTALGDFDIVGFTFQYELHYSTMVNLLELGHIPLYAKDRPDFPLVVGGGPSAFNPEPVADFFDVIVLGDGEDVSVELAQIVANAKKNGESKESVLLKLAQLDGVYVPQFYEPAYENDQFKALVPIREDVPKIIKTRTVDALPAENYAEKPLVPNVSTAHDRVSLEIARGCSRGCRFCNAGMIYRPVRERSPEDLVEQAVKNIKATGYDEVSLVSLSTSDYSQLETLLGSLQKTMADKMVNLAFPSLRPESFTEKIAQFAKGVRKSGLTLAPEAGSQRLRNVINKATTEDELLTAMDIAFTEGWNLVKLYFMIGQPTENEDDLQGLVDLIISASRLAKKHQNKHVNVSVSPFVPKASTPFQWARQDSEEKTQQKIDFLCGKIKAKNVKLSWREPDVAAVEGVLARGDRRLAKVVHRVQQMGAKLEGWSEHFDAEKWCTALSEENLTIEQYLSGFDLNAPLPWGHINKGVTKKYLRQDYEKALQEQQVPDCRLSDCHSCGLMAQQVCKDIRHGNVKKSLEKPEPVIVQEEKSKDEKDRGRKIYRVQYKRGDGVRYLSHLDILRVFERAMRRSNIPLAFTEGFNPRPKVAFGPALPIGMTSETEFIDIYLDCEKEIDLKTALQPQLPGDMELIKEKVLDKKPQALSAIINRAEFKVEFTQHVDFKDLSEKCKQLLNSGEILIQRLQKKKSRQIDIRKYLFDFEIFNEALFIRTNIIDGHSVKVSEIFDQLFDDGDTLYKTSNISRTDMWICKGDELVSPVE